MCYLLPVMYAVFDNSGNHSLNGHSLRHTQQIQSLHHQKLAPWPKTALDIAQILFATFLFHFLMIESLELTATKHLWTYLHLNVINTSGCSRKWIVEAHGTYGVKERLAFSPAETPLRAGADT